MDIEDPSQLERLITGLQDLYETGLVTDVILVAGDTEVPCHRSVLAACSPYFRAMFRSQMSESCAEKIELHNVPSAILRPLIEYIYYSSVTIDNDNVQDLFCTANLFELSELHDVCAQYMLKELHPSNCMDVYRVASLYENEFLKSVSKAYIVKYFAQIAPTGDLNKMELDEFLRIISSDDLDIKTEELVFEAVVSYVQHDFATRKSHLPMLMKSVRIGLLTEDYMNDVVGSTDVIMKDPFCRSMISLARLQVAACGSVGMGEEDALELEAPSQVKKRFGMHCTDLVVFVGAGQKPDAKGFGCYNPATGNNYFAISPQMGFDFRNRIDHHRMVVTKDNQIFVVGGVLFENYEICKSGEAMSTVEYFNFENNSWVRMAQMMERRCAHALATLGNYIYAIGGKTLFPQGDPLPTMESYNIEKDRWEYAADMPLPLYHHQAVAHKNKILVIGGLSMEDVVSKVIYQYTPSCNMWETYTMELEQPRAEFGVALLSHDLYVCGGWNGKIRLCTMECLNLEEQTQRRGGELHEDRKSPALFVFHDNLYLCGGMRLLLMPGKQPKEMMSRDLWKYDMSNEVWLHEAVLVPYANIHACAVAEINIKKLQESDFVSKKKD